jgi:hypothetical protein
VNSLPVVATGLVIVFLDVGSAGWDWVPDPIGWVLVLVGLMPVKERLPAYAGVSGAAWVCLAISVLTLPPDSVATIDPTLGWLFSLPTIAFCFLLCDSLADVTEDSLSARFRWLRAGFVVVGALPGLVYLAGLEWMTIPSAVAPVLADVVLVFSIWAAADSGDEETERPSRPTRPEPRQVTGTADRGGRRKKDQGFDAEEVRRRARARRARGG